MSRYGIFSIMKKIYHVKERITFNKKRLTGVHISYKHKFYSCLFVGKFILPVCGVLDQI